MPIGPTSGGGLPPGSTVTAAALTVLDDASVAAMVNTLGGDTSTGSGGLVRVSGATLVSPVLGVASATSIAFGESALSNYLVSTFTPTVTLVGGAGNTVPSYSTTQARSTRVGNRVFVNINLENSSGGTAGAGTGQINILLPIAASASSVARQFYICGRSLNGSTVNHLGVYITPSATTVKVYLMTSDLITGQFIETSMTGDDQNNTSRNIHISFNYEV